MTGTTGNRRAIEQLFITHYGHASKNEVDFFIALGLSVQTDQVGSEKQIIRCMGFNPTNSRSCPKFCQSRLTVKDALNAAKTLNLKMLECPTMSEVQMEQALSDAAPDWLCKGSHRENEHQLKDLWKRLGPIVEERQMLIQTGLHAMYTEQYQKTIACGNEQLAQKDEQIASANDQLALKDGQIASINEQLAQKESQIVYGGQQLEQQNKEIEFLKQFAEKAFSLASAHGNCEEVQRLQDAAKSFYSGVVPVKDDT